MDGLNTADLVRELQECKVRGVHRVVVKVGANNCPVVAVYAIQKLPDSEPTVYLVVGDPID